MKKILSFIAVFVMCMAIMPNVYAEVKVGTVSDITSKDTIVGNEGDADPANLNPTIDPDGGKASKVTVTYDGTVIGESLKIVKADDSDRNIDAAWIGVRVTPDTSVSTGKYHFRQSPTSEWQEIDTADDNGVLDIYVPVTPEKLEEALETGFIEYTFEFDWDTTHTGAEQCEVNQTVVVRIDIKTITLKDEDESETDLWSPAIYEEKYEAAHAEEESNPETSDINVAFLISMILISGCGVVYTIKRRFN